MSSPEDVDEINEYLQARRKKQDLGELPRPDATPGFVKKLSTAIFGPPKVIKVPLNSTQVTSASPQAQTAVRKQLEEIMQEKKRATIVATPRPIASTPAPSAQPARTLANVPSNAAISSAPVARFAPPSKPTPSPPTTIPAYYQSTKTNPVSFPAPASTSTPSSLPPRENTRYMPPWVARQQQAAPPAPRVSPPLMSGGKEVSFISPAKYIPPAPFNPNTNPVRETTFPTIAREDAPVPKNEPARTLAFQSGEVKIDEELAPAPPRKPVVASPSSSYSHDHEPEMTEEEALEKLPFEDVEGLSQEDLAYLERKEKEHRAAQEQQESDHVSPDALRAQLERQSSQVETAAPQNPENPTSSGSDEKRKILERLRKMMAAEAPPTNEN